MVSAVSSPTTQATSALSASDSKSNVAQLKSELAAKQAELAAAKTDDEKSSINAEISQLKAQISATQVTGGGASSNASGAAGGQKADDDRHHGRFNTADKAAPEGKVSSANMDVLMRLQKGGAPNAAQIYANMDGDDDGKVTKDEFVAANAERMGKDEAGKLYASIDTQNTGSITEDQFAKSLADHDRHGGGAHMGPPPGGMPAWGDQSDTAPADQSATIS